MIATHNTTGQPVTCQGCEKPIHPGEEWTERRPIMPGRFDDVFYVHPRCRPR